MSSYDYVEPMYKKSWVLIDSSNPRVNLWECNISNGNHYREAFWKEIDPNQRDSEMEKTLLAKRAAAKRRELHGQNHEASSLFFEKKDAETNFHVNPYNTLLRKFRLTARARRDLELTEAQFRNKIMGKDYFTRHELEYLNALLGYSNLDASDLRYLVNPDYWMNKRFGPID